jgi:hypothetical protein
MEIMVIVINAMWGCPPKERLMPVHALCVTLRMNRDGAV